MHLAESSSTLFCLWTGLLLPVALHPASRRRSYLPLRTGQCSRPEGTFTLLLVRTFRRTFPRHFVPGYDRCCPYETRLQTFRNSIFSGTGVRYSTRTKSKLQFIQLVRVHRVMTPVPGEQAMRRKKNKANKSVNLQVLPVVNPDAAGIDVGAKEHLVAVPCDRDPKPVRTFQAFTPDLHELAAWLKRCGIQTVALESTGIYWISLYEVLEQHGFEIRVVNARHVKHVPGRTKTDVLDCQWIQKLHSFGLLNGSFRPDQQIRKLRTYMRLRDNLVVASTQAVHHMQKAFFEMNVQLSNVISDIVGETGLTIVEAIIAGQRDPKQLAALCRPRIKASRETVAKSLHGNWDDAVLFALKIALETYRFTQAKIQDCDCCIQRHLAQFESRAELINSPQNLKAQLHRVCGVDLTKI